MDTETEWFDRQLWCLLGLTFDAVTMEEAISRITTSIARRDGCYFTTPNLNFCVTSLDNPAFRNTIVASDLVLLDGMPLFWMAKLLGVLLPEKVSGSDLFDQLWNRKLSENRRIKVYFFGGDAGVAQEACKKINGTGQGMICVGARYPGFGDVGNLSTNEMIDEINHAKADFLVVALGAVKGQLWIERNRKQLGTPVISHLGAVVNFVAGGLKRAPVPIQKIGFEWLWRIFQEPSLWRRYLNDGLRFLRLLVLRVLPLAIWNGIHRRQLAVAEPVRCDLTHSGERIEIAVKGACVYHTLDPLRDAFRQVASRSTEVKLDLSNVWAIDGVFLGLCILLSKCLNNAGKNLSISGLSPSVKRLFHWNCADYLL